MNPNYFAEKPLISVVIPTYNRADSLQKAIESVLNQTYSAIELIIVDDGSTDHTEQVVSSFCTKRVNYIKLAENTKGRLARNRGILESTGQYIAFLDSDDYWLPTKLEKQQRYLLAQAFNRENVMCFTNVIIDTGFRKKHKQNAPLNKELDIMEYILAGRNIVQTSTYLVSAKLAKQTLFDATLKKHQDWDFCLRLQQQGAQFIYCPIAETIWNCDNRQDRISVGSQHMEQSLHWFEQNKEHLSIQAQHCFKQEIMFPALLRQKRYKSILQLFIESKQNASLPTRQFIKKMIVMGLFIVKLKKV